MLNFKSSRMMTAFLLGLSFSLFVAETGKYCLISRFFKMYHLYSNQWVQINQHRRPKYKPILTIHKNIKISSIKTIFRPIIFPFDKAGHDSIIFVSVPQRSGKAIKCDVPGTKIITVSPTYYDTKSTTFARFVADVKATLTNHCASSNGSYIQVTNALFTGSLFPEGTTRTNPPPI